MSEPFLYMRMLLSRVLYWAYTFDLLSVAAEALKKGASILIFFWFCASTFTWWVSALGSLSLWHTRLIYILVDCVSSFAALALENSIWFTLTMQECGLWDPVRLWGLIKQRWVPLLDISCYYGCRERLRGPWIETTYAFWSHSSLKFSNDGLVIWYRDMWLILKI